MLLIDLAGSLASLADALPLAHEIGYPHQEPVKPKSSGGASPVVVGGGVVATVGLAGALFWVRERTRRADAEADAPVDEPKTQHS
jgi:hypothetical protein